MPTRFVWLAALASMLDLPGQTPVRALRRIRRHERDARLQFLAQFRIAQITLLLLMLTFVIAGSLLVIVANASNWYLAPAALMPAAAALANVRLHAITRTPTSPGTGA